MTLVVHKVVNGIFCCMSFCFVIMTILSFVSREWTIAAFCYALSWLVQLIRVAFFSIEIPKLCVHPFMSKLSRDYVKAPLTFVIITVAALYFFTFVFNRPDDVTVKSITESYNDCFNCTSDDSITVTEFRKYPVALQWRFAESVPVMDGINSLLTSIQDIASKEIYTEQDVINIKSNVNSLQETTLTSNKSSASILVLFLCMTVAVCLLFFQQSWQSYLMYIEVREENI